MKITVRNLTKKIKDSEVLSDINLVFESGNVYGLCGENGSGKTMLMRAICGLILPSKGEVDIDGEIIGKDIDFPRSIGVLIENPAFVSNMTAIDNLLLLGSIRGEVNIGQIREYLRKINLDPDSKKKYRKFSLGMKQRLGIAAAFFEEQNIIILDEPYNALDENSVNSLNDMIMDAKRRGAIVLISSHNGTLLNEISDIIYRMRDGKIE